MKKSRKNGGTGRKAAPALWRPELDAAMPPREGLADMLNRLVREEREARAVITALGLTAAARSPAPESLPEAARDRLAELAALRGEGSLLAALFLDVMRLHGQYLPPDAGARASLDESARACGIETWRLAPGTAAADDSDATACVCDAEPLIALAATQLSGLYALCAVEFTTADARALVDGLMERARRGSWEALEEARNVLSSPATFVLYADSGTQGKRERPEGVPWNEEEDLPLNGEENELALMDAMARDGCVAAMHALGSLWLCGCPERDTDRKKARFWLEKAWQAGDLDAGAELAVMGLEKWLRAGVKHGPVPAKPLAMLRELAEQGVSGACNDLGEILFRQARGRAEREEAMAWLGRAGELGLAGTNLTLAVMMVKEHPDLPADVTREDGLALLRRGAEHGQPEFLAELAPFRMTGLDGRPADAAEGRAMLEEAAGFGSYEAMGRLADIHLQGLCGFPVDAREGLKLADRVRTISMNERCEALATLARLGEFGEEAARESVLDAKEALGNLKGSFRDPLLAIFRLCFPKEAARLTAGLEAEAGDADAAKPAEAAEPAGTAEEEARERTVQEMVDGLMNVSAVHDGARLAHVFADALRAADIGALHYLDRAVGRLPDTPWRQHLIAGFSMALELAEPLSYEALRALTARSLNDAPGVWKEYVLEAEDRPAQEDEQ